MKPRVLHLTPSYPPVVGGIEDHVANLVDRLPQQGYDPVVLTPERRESSRESSPDIYREKSLLSIHKSRFAPGVVTKLFQLDYDLLHVHAPFHFGLEFATLAAKLQSLPLLITVHMYDARNTRLYQLYQSIVYDRCIDAADRIIPTTTDYIEGYDTFERNADKISPVPLGVDTTHFSPRQESRARLGYSENENILLFVGAMERHHFYKDINLLIQAFSQSRSADRLVLVGSGDRVPEFKQTARKLNVADSVEFPGYISDEQLPHYYSAADLFVLPSKGDRGEAFGIVLLEAMACDTPVLATDIPGVRSVVEDGGLVVSPGDNQLMTEAIDKGLTQANHGSFAPRDHVIARYSQSAVVRKVTDIYDSLV